MTSKVYYESDSSIWILFHFLSVVSVSSGAPGLNGRGGRKCVDGNRKLVSTSLQLFAAAILVVEEVICV